MAPQSKGRVSGHPGHPLDPPLYLFPSLYYSIPLGVYNTVETLEQMLRRGIKENV